jgi:hypothetical protein
MGMFVFIGDETNVTQSRKARFFIYGGLIIAADRALETSNKVASIRAKWGFAPEDELKFDSRSKPGHLSNDEFAQAKNEIVEVCHKLEAKFMAYAVHHSIASTTPKAQVWLRALNTLLCAFDLFLQRENSHGICLVDRFQSDLSVLGTIHKQGVDPKFWGGELPHRLENVWCYGTVSIDTTHLVSMVDVVLGAFRYCVNETGRTAVPLQLYRRLRPLMVCEPGNPSQVEEWGLFLRPKEIKAAVYEQDYEALRERLRSLE